MSDTLLKLRDLLNASEKRRALLLLCMMLFLGMVEVVGVASILPLIAVLSDPTLIETNRWLKIAYAYFNFDSQKAFFIFLCLSVFLLIALRTLVTALSSYGALWFAQSCIHRISSTLMNVYLGRPYVWFLNRHSADLSKTVLSEVEQVVNGCLKPAMQLLSQVIVAFMIGALLIAIEPVAALTALVVIGSAYGAAYGGIRRYIHRKGTQRLAANRLRFKIAQEVFAGVKEVKVGGVERAYLGQFEESSAEVARLRTKLNLARELPRYLLELIAFGGILSFILVLVIRSPGGFNSSIPVLALYAFAGIRLLPAIQAIYQNVVTLRFEVPALDALHDELRVDDAPRKAKPDSRVPFKSKIELEAVSFSYVDTTKPALKNVNLSIRAGAKVGVIGATGAGKSTLLDVLLGLLEPQSGQMIVDGVVIDSNNAAAWQRSIGYVPQHIFLSDDTVAANIALGQRPQGIDMEAVIRAAKLAKLHDFVTQELPLGYETKVGDRGVRLSGGQRQRIGIARALYQDPDVLILDEATSALDGATESSVMMAVNDIGDSKTIIMIAHRLSTLEGCEVIYEMEAGQIVREGTFAEIIGSIPPS